MNNIKAVIFDMDGILLDSETICDKTWILALKEFNIIYVKSQTKRKDLRTFGGLKFLKLL